MMMTLSIALLLVALLGAYITGFVSLAYLLPENPGKKVAYAKARQ